MDNQKSIFLFIVKEIKNYQTLISSIEQLFINIELKICNTIKDSKDILLSEYIDLIIAEHNFKDGTVEELFDEYDAPCYILLYNTIDYDVLNKALSNGISNYIIVDDDEQYIKPLIKLIQNCLEHYTSNHNEPVINVSNNFTKIFHLMEIPAGLFRVHFDDDNTLCISTIEINNEFEIFFGFSKEDIVNKKLSKLPSDKVEKLKQVIFDTNKNKDSINIEFYSDWLERNIRLSSIYIKDDTIAVIISDKTDEHVIDQKSSAIIQNIPFNITYYSSKDLKIEWANLSTAKSADVPFDEVIGKHCYTIWHNRKEPCDDCSVLKAFETGKTCTAENNTADGRTWNSWASPVISDNKVIGVVEVAIDITEKKQMENLLVQSEQRYRSLQENVPICLFRNSIDGTNLTINAAGMKMFGFSSDAKQSEIDIRNLYVNVDDRKRFINKLLHDGIVSDYSVELYKADGSTFWGSVSAKKVVNEKGEILYIDGAIENITIRKQYDDLIKTRLEREQLVASLLKKLINISTKNYHEVMMKTLCSLGQYADVDGCYLFWINIEAEFIEHKYIWNKDREDYDEQRNETESVKSFNWVMKHLKNGQVVNISSLEELPEDANHEKLVWNSLGVKSLLSVPLMQNNKLIGFMGYSTNNVIRNWNDDDVSLLKLIGEVHVNVYLRHKAEEKLIENESKYRAITENSPDIIMRFDRNLKCLFVNEAVRKISPFQPEYFIGKTLDILEIPDILYHKWTKQIKEVFSTGKQYVGSFKSNFLNDVYHFDLRIIPEFNEVGVVETVLSTSRDITKIMKAEESLRHSEEMFRQLAENINEVFWLSEKDKILYVSPAFKDIWGISHTELIESPSILMNSIYEEDRYTITKLFEYSKSSDDLFDQEFRIVRPDGNIRWIWMRTFPVFDNSKVIRRAGFVEDITNRKSMEEHLRNTIYEKSAIIENSVVGIIYIKGLKILWINRKMEEMSGYTKRDLIGKSIRKIYISSSYLRQEIRAFMSSIRELGSYHSENLFLRKDGTTFWCSFSGKAVDIDDISKGTIWVVEDITERKQSEHLLFLQRDLGLKLSYVTELRKALEYVLDAVLQVEGIDSGGIYLVDEQTMDVNLVVHRGFSNEFVKSVKKFDYRDIQTKILFAGSKLYHSKNEFQDLITNVRDWEDFKSISMIPIEHESRIIGSLNLASHTHYRIPKRSKNALETIATQVGATIVHLKTEISLKENKNNLQNLYDTIDDFLIVLNKKGEIIECNTAVVNRLNYTKDYLIGQSIMKLYPDDSEFEISSFLDNVISKNPSTTSIPLKSRSNNFIQVVTKYFKGQWSGQEVYFCISHDISERFKALEAQRQSEKRFRQLLENIDLIAIILDVEGNIIFCNDFLLSLTGWERSELIDKNWFRLVLKEEESKIYLESYRNGLVEGNINTSLEYKIFTRDEIEKIIQWTVTIIHDIDGKIIGSACIGKDVTEYKKAENLLLQSSKLAAIGEAAAGMAHEIHQPLFTIRMITDTLSSMTEKEEFDRKYFIAELSRIIKLLERSVDIINELRAFARPTSSLYIEVDVNTVIKDTLVLVREQFAKNNINIILNLDDSIFEIEGNSNQIGQVVLNLLNNSKDALTGMDKKTIRISTFMEKENVVVEFSDNGSGMKKEVLDKLFIPFFTTKTRKEGMGLGLSISYRIIKEHKGEINVSSKEGIGTTFKIIIPSIK